MSNEIANYHTLSKYVFETRIKRKLEKKKVRLKDVLTFIHEASNETFLLHSSVAF